MTTIKEQLESMAKETDNELKKYVINYLLKNNETDEEIKEDMEGLQNHGCQSGWVSGLVYFSETRAFYDIFYEDIEELREEWEDRIGEIIKINGDLKNFFAWFGFEQKASEIYSELFEN